MSYVAPKCLEAARAGSEPPLAFDTMFKLVSFDASADTVKAVELRNKCMIAAYRKFKAPTGAPLTMVFNLKLDGGVTSKGATDPTAEGNLTIFVPYPVPDAYGNVRTVGSSEALLRRIDTTPADLLELMGETMSGYFLECRELGKPSSLAQKWVWLTRCVAPRQYIMVPFTSSDNVRWANALGKGGHRTAQYEAFFGNEYITPDDKDDSDTNKRFWAFLLSKIPKFDTLRIPTMVEAPAPRPELIDSEAIDKAVVTFTKLKAAVTGAFTAESQDKPAHDKPSATAEIVGAVAVAAGVALATGVVAAIL